MTIRAVPKPTTIGPAKRGPGKRAPGKPAPARGAPDRLSVALFSLALLLILFALLAHELGASRPGRATARFALVRKVYRTRVLETVVGPGPSTGSSVTQSIASSGPPSSAPLVSTRAS